MASELLPVSKYLLPIYNKYMTDHLSTGALGEACAVSFLTSLGHTILDRNVRTSFGELDIISRDPDGTLVIVEVKTLSSPGHLSPEDNLTRAKLFKLSRMAAFYANRHPQLVDDRVGWRIDLVAIVLDPLAGPNIQLHDGVPFSVSHYKNIC